MLCLSNIKIHLMTWKVLVLQIHKRWRNQEGAKYFFHTMWWLHNNLLHIFKLLLLCFCVSWFLVNISYKYNYKIIYVVSKLSCLCVAVLKSLILLPLVCTHCKGNVSAQVCTQCETLTGFIFWIFFLHSNLYGKRPADYAVSLEMLEIFQEASKGTPYVNPALSPSASLSVVRVHADANNVFNFIFLSLYFICKS